MDALEALVAAKKASHKKLLQGKKLIKRVEREDAELHAAASDRPAAKRPATAATQPEASQTAAEGSGLPISRSLSNKARKVGLPGVEVMRRLRTLEQPATLFGEDEHARRKRLLAAESEITMLDEEAGGGDRGNMLHEIRKKQQSEAAEAAAEAAESGRAQPDTAGTSTAPGPRAPGDSAADDGTAQEEAEEDPVMSVFKGAAKRLEQKKLVDAMCLEDKILHYLQLYISEWKADLDARSKEARMTSKAKEATDAFTLTASAFEAIYPRLHARSGIHQEVLIGIGMMITAMHERNFSSAIETYLRLSIGNATWPIGVTSVGIHARSARERISHYANAPSQAHIMNDEATRKFLQGMKRLVSAYQRLHPTDPSRSVDFNAIQHAGLGALGGSEKVMFLKNEAEGAAWKAEIYVPAPHFVEKDGTIKVPQKWGNTLRAEEERMMKD